MRLFEEPLFSHNLFPGSNSAASIREAGCTKLGRFLRDRSNITSVRLIYRVVEEVCAAPSINRREFTMNRALCVQWSDGLQYCFPSRSIAASVGEWQEGESAAHSIQDEGKTSRLPHASRGGLSSLVQRFPREGSWRSLYQLPVEKRTSSGGSSTGPWLGTGTEQRDRSSGCLF